MGEEDLEAVLSIESVSFSRPWTRRHFLDEISSTFGFPTVAFLPDGTVAGYLCLKQVLDEAEILDVAVSPTFRGKGIGRILVQHALESARGRGGHLVWLEVRVANREAIQLYESLGFREIARRKGYYDGGEDAIVMQHESDRSVRSD